MEDRNVYLGTFIDRFFSPPITRLMDSMGMGPEQGGLAPFDIHFQYAQDGETVDHGIVPFDPVAVPCHQAISVSTLLKGDLTKGLFRLAAVYLASFLSSEFFFFSLFLLIVGRLKMSRATGNAARGH